MTSRMLPTAVLVTTLAATALDGAFAQNVSLSGKIEHVFDGRVLLKTEENSFLVALPEGIPSDSMEQGQQVMVEGTRSGSDISATAVRLESGKNNENAASDAQKGDASATQDLPEELTGLNLSGLRIDKKDDETKYRGRLEGDIKFEAKYDRDGRLEEVKTESKGRLPEKLVSRLLTDELRTEIADLGFQRLNEIEIEDDEIEIEGLDTEGRSVEAEFDRSSLLLEFKRKGTGSRRDGPPMQFERDTLREIARSAGYTEIGDIKIKGNHADVHATNPDDEPVEVRINADGQIKREEQR